MKGKLELMCNIKNYKLFPHSFFINRPTKP